MSGAPSHIVRLLVGEILIHFSGSWQIKGNQHSLVQVTFTFYTLLESLYYNLVEDIRFEAIFTNIKEIYDGLFNW